MSSYFNLEKSFAFYGAYHSNRINTLIHVLCVPLIFTTSIELLSRFTPSWVIHGILSFYMISFIIMEPMCGFAYAPVLYLYYWIATNILWEYPNGSFIILVLSWAFQFLGHGVYEKRAPALLTNLPQSLHAAVFFVWLELLFALGFRKPLARSLQAAVRAERRRRKFK